jgi:hypothetical protein
MNYSPLTASWITPEQAKKWIREGEGEGIRIAILDSGVESTHPRLDGINLLDDIAVVDHGLRIKIEDGGGKDLYGHGSAVADVIHQVAPKAQVGSIRVLSDRLSSRSAIIREGVRQALDRGYHILNCSFGCRGEERFVLQYKDWVDEAYLKGRHVVAACNNQNYLTPEWPSHFSSVVSVNMAQTDDEYFFFRHGNLVEFAAMGEAVEVAWMGGARKVVTGSSYAAPRVSAWLARLLSKSGPLSPLVAKAAMQRVAAPWVNETKRAFEE